MSSYIGDIAEAVKDALNAACTGLSPTISQEFVAERVYTPEKKLTDISALVVQVFARASVRTRESRADIRKEIEVDVLYAVPVDQLTDPDTDDATMNATLDGFAQLGEEMADVISDKDALYAGSHCLRVEHDPIVDFEVLRNERVFASLLKCFFPRW